MGPTAEAPAPSVAELKLQQKLRTGQRGKPCRDFCSSSIFYNHVGDFVNDERETIWNRSDGCTFGDDTCFEVSEGQSQFDEAAKTVQKYHAIVPFMSRMNFWSTCRIPGRPVHTWKPMARGLTDLLVYPSFLCIRSVAQVPSRSSVHMNVYFEVAGRGCQQTGQYPRGGHSHAY